jgi:soluble lytic murein transglycosylase-like protein
MKHRSTLGLPLLVMSCAFIALPIKAESQRDSVMIWTDKLLAEATRRAESAEQAVRDHAARSEPVKSVTVAAEQLPLEVGTDSAELPDLIRKILADEGLPPSLIGLAQAESGLNSLALSSKGARGIWQLMPDTARTFGLAVDSRRDDRIDPIRSTIAAARYLRLLYARWGAWDLAFAAYNAGAGAVERALAGGDSWPSLFERRLPAETRDYVPKVWREIYRGDPASLSNQETGQ